MAFSIVEDLSLHPLRIPAWTLCSSIGDGCAATLEALRSRRTGLRPNDFGTAPLPTWAGRVPDLEHQPLPTRFAAWDCRNNRLAWRGLRSDGFLEAVYAARERFGADRIAVVLGTSTSSIGASEDAYCRLEPDGTYPADLRRPIIHTPHSLGDFVQHALELTGLAVTVATACSSSAKAFAQAARMIQLGLADAAVVGGVDTLCGSVLFGFNSLELVSPEPCQPFDVERHGISLGEAAGFALLQPQAEHGPWFIGYGESSDAHHMSSPHPEGRGARAALDEVFRRARIGAQDIDYINLHGTASRKNDEMEAGVVAELFPASTAASSTKGWTGHTLGAAGIVEAGITLLALEHAMLPGTLNTRRLDPVCGPQVRIDNAATEARLGLSFSFGFGGSNCVLAFARSDVH
jgi:3-oxoacyl-[acyl-carrier-protein] synthase I